ncbi:hypothetical protein N0V88_000780 [Collariella sp. IMI 366227]|nr:hypothetical protein N0V88_000780 [Collariella sp. IMI 366227]
MDMAYRFLVFLGGTGHVKRGLYRDLNENLDANPGFGTGVNVSNIRKDWQRDPNILISYDFNWPGGGNLTSSSISATTAFCAVSMFSLGTPTNITDKYTEENTKSTDCRPALGDACVNAILAGAQEDNNRTSHRCFTRWDQYPECADTFGMAEYSLYKNRLILSPDYLYDIHTKSGEPFHVIPTEEEARGYPGLYKSAANMLQVVLLRPPREANEAYHPTLNCMRVMTNTEWAAAKDKGQDGDAGGNEDSEGDKNGTGHLAARLWVLVGTLGFAALL